jgi:hypothetical protein
MCEMGNTIIEQTGVLIAGLDTAREKIAFHCLGPGGALINRIDLTALKHRSGTATDKTLGAYNFLEAPITVSAGQTKGLSISAGGLRELLKTRMSDDSFTSLDAAGHGAPFKIDIHFRSVNGNYEMVQQQVTMNLILAPDAKLDLYKEL